MYGDSDDEDEDDEDASGSEKRRDSSDGENEEDDEEIEKALRVSWLVRAVGNCWVWNELNTNSGRETASLSILKMKGVSR